MGTMAADKRRPARYPFGVKPAENEETVERLPRGRGLKLSGPMLTRIGMTLLLLVMLLLMQRRCADAISNVVTGVGSDGSAGSAVARPGTIDVPSAVPDTSDDKYEHPGSNMSLEETKAMIERAKAKEVARAAVRAAEGAAGGGSAGSGSAAGGGSAGSGSAAGTGSAGRDSAITP